MGNETPVRQGVNVRRGWVIAAWVVAGTVVCGAVAFGLSWWLIAPHLEGADEYPGGVVLRDNAGRVLRVSLGPDDEDCRPYYVASKEDWIVKALVAAEDRRFFEHAGVNLPSVMRATFQNISSLRRVSGASTITMQATRLILPHPRTLAWKYVEAFRAMQTERARDKLWIISQYLNRAPFGSNLVGVEAAAQGWFGKRTKDLGMTSASARRRCLRGWCSVPRGSVPTATSTAPSNAAPTCSGACARLE